jgi:hypothetical protein
MNLEIQNYNQKLEESDKQICNFLATTIDQNLVESEITSKIWHGHPVWFWAKNPIVGYSKQKNSVALLFWSGQSFEEEKLTNIGSFKASCLYFKSLDEVGDLEILLNKAKTIQWDYKNIAKRKGILEKLL